MAVRFRLDFTDGTSVDVERRPVHVMRAERLATADTGMTEQVLLMMWAAHTGGTGNRGDFETWVETLSDYDRVEVDADPPAPGSGTSPD